jgi:hypothetical protein
VWGKLSRLPSRMERPVSIAEPTVEQRPIATVIGTEKARGPLAFVTIRKRPAAADSEAFQDARLP